MQEIKITDVEGITIGHAQDLEAATGCTVILGRDGVSAGVDVRGGAPGTRETDLLNPMNMVDMIHGVLLTGGSAFGLDAAAGVMQYLEERDIGFDVTVTKVPIVCGAVLFDLNIGRHNVRPDKEMGYEACLKAGSETCNNGNVGAGAGATVGKILGPERAMKSGLGTYCIETGDLKVGALVVVSCFGDVIDPDTGKTLAGVLDSDQKTFLHTEQIMINEYDDGKNPFMGNTTLGTIITNAKLDKAQANKIASMSHNAFGRTIRPAHTMFDGDTVFTMATNRVEADINVVGLLSTRIMEQAVKRAVTETSPLCGFKCYKDI